MIYKLVYDIELPSTNEIINQNRINRYAAASQKKKYTKLIAYLTKEQMKEKIKNKVDVSCNWFVKNKRKDKDNISGGIKFILDGLQEAGVIENDGWEQIGDIHHYFYVDKNNPRVELRLEERE